MQRDALTHRGRRFPRSLRCLHSVHKLPQPLNDRVNGGFEWLRAAVTAEGFPVKGRATGRNGSGRRTFDRTVLTALSLLLP